MATKDGCLLVTSDGYYLKTADEILEERLKNDIVKRVEAFECNKVYEALLMIKFSHCLTTNYDNVLLSLFGAERKNSIYGQKSLYNIRRKIQISRRNFFLGGGLAYTWNISESQEHNVGT